MQTTLTTLELETIKSRKGPWSNYNCQYESWSYAAKVAFISPADITGDFPDGAFVLFYKGGGLQLNFYPHEGELLAKCIRLIAGDEKEFWLAVANRDVDNPPPYTDRTHKSMRKKSRANKNVSLEDLGL